jgi:hypothetical protein
MVSLPCVWCPVSESNPMRVWNPMKKIHWETDFVCQAFHPCRKHSIFLLHIYF